MPTSKKPTSGAKHAKPKSATASSLPAATSFADVLTQVGPRPDSYGKQKDKKAYAEKLSHRAAVLIANRPPRRSQIPRHHPPQPRRLRSGKELPQRRVQQAKKTGVGSTLSGLELLVSIKTLSFRHIKNVQATGEHEVTRYTKNMGRNDHELRAKAMEFHERFPYANLFMPLDSCDDAKADKFSFAHAVMTFRNRVGANVPTNLRNCSNSSTSVCTSGRAVVPARSNSSTSATRHPNAAALEGASHSKS